jgi:Trypsin-like peptidase domain/AAA ATPase domain
VAEVPVRQRVVEVEADLGEGSSPQFRYGSGLLIGERHVLTAAHVVSGAAAVTVRSPEKVRLAANLDTALVGDPDRLDLALLEVPEAEVLPQVEVAVVDRDVTGGEVIEDCWAVGYPEFAEVRRDATGRSLRETKEVHGSIAPLSGLVEGLLSLEVTSTPRPLPAGALDRSEWSGMSGAAVFAGTRLVGVVAEHAPRRGSSDITLTPLDVLIKSVTAPPAAASWLTRLGIRDPQRVHVLGRAQADLLKVRLQPLLTRHRIFGGRDTELAALDGFVERQPGGYFFVSALSGLGKTALLAHWLRRLEQRNGSAPGVAYTFISRLDGLADEEFVLRNLCQQLALVHGETGPLPAATTELRARYIRLLTTSPPNKGVVVTIDGLDEASGWAPGPDLFPPDLPEHVWVVFSARDLAGTNWLDLLQLDGAGVDVLSLATLEHGEIAQLLASADVPDWAREPAAIDAMFDVSSGDPFYVRYLVEDLAEERITSAEDLRTRPAGLTGYFDEWWKEVAASATERRVRDLLGYLLVSKGPLARAELTGISDADDLDGWTFETALEPVRRFVIGDAVSGYSLCHHRFQTYLSTTRLQEQDQQPYRERLLRWADDWRTHRGRYALTYYVSHLADAARAAAGDDLDVARKLGGLVADSEFHQTYLDVIDDLPALQRDLELALETVARAPRAPLETLVPAALALEDFRRSWFRPESVFELAEMNRVADAEKRLSLFEIDQEWQQLARLVIVWLSAQGERASANELRSRVSTELQPHEPLPLLLARIETWLGERAAPQLRMPYPPFELPPPPPLEIAQHLVSRMGGATDPEVQYRGITTLHERTVAQADAAPVYIAEGDSPFLVAYAVAHPGEGDALLHQYIAIHAGNPYADYRNRSLWGILAAALCHPNDYAARDYARLLATAALAAAPVRFREGLRVTVVGLRARSGGPGPIQQLDVLVDQARGAAAALEQERWLSDSWGHHARRLAALSEVHAHALGREDEATMLLDQALALPFGFAGYQAPSSLTLAEANRICRPHDPAASMAAVEAARRAAHNIQEPGFCARTTARVNAMLERWWAHPLADLAGIVSRFVDDPHAREFSPLHRVGEEYGERSRGEERLEMPDGVLSANTLTRLAHDVYHVSAAETRRLNEDFAADEVLRAGTVVAVPDAKFAPLLAARFAAEALVQDGLTAAEREGLIRKLVPIATGNPTALDTVLARLLLAASPDAPNVLDAIASVAPSEWLMEPAASAAVEFYGPS